MSAASSARELLEAGAGALVLRDGSVVALRPARPEDETALREFGRRLPSPPARLHPGELPVGGGERLDAPLHVEGFTLVAELRGRLIAAARCAHDAARPGVGVLTLVVDERVQGKGLGTALLDRLAEIACERGIGLLEGDISAQNHRMLDLIAISGFEVVRQLDGGMVRARLELAPTPRDEQRLHERQAESAVASARIFLEPRAVAVVGASRDPEKIGSIVLRNLRSAGFTGRILPINPTAREIDGLPAFARLVDAPEPIDLAVIAVPHDAVPAVVDDCIEKGVRGILLLTAGYAESGAEGRERERALLAQVRGAGLRLIGPNCFGVINTDPAVRLNTSFSPTRPLEGHVALLTQSGALGQAILDYARDLRLGLSSFVSIGNKADLSGNDLLEYWGQDRRTTVVLLYLESFGNPRRFSRIARTVAREKPIVCVKSGRSRAGARAASSHTGSLAGSDEAVEAMFRQCGVIRTDTLEELFDVATLLAHQPLPAGPRVAILTNAGGPGIMAADACEARGLELPTLEDETVRTLRSFLPPSAALANPVDMIAGADASHYRRALEALLRDANVDSVLVLFVPLKPGSPERVAAAIREAAASAGAKPVLATFLSAQGMPPELAEIPSYRFPEGAVAALARAWRHARWLERPPGSPRVFNDIDAGAARGGVERVRERGGGWLAPDEAGALLEAAGIPAARAATAVNQAQALEAAREIGYPVALKAVGPEIVHKTEVGGVKLDLPDDAALRAAYDDLRSRLGGTMSAVLVQRMVPAGVEVLIGATLDETFGHVIAYGSGGTMVELMHDVALRLQPLSEPDVDEMLAEVRGTALLRGWRGRPRADEPAVRDVLHRLSALLELCPEIEEVDLNPTVVLERGCIVVDARVRVASTWRRHGPRASY